MGEQDRQVYVYVHVYVSGRMVIVTYGAAILVHALVQHLDLADDVLMEPLHTVPTTHTQSAA